MALRAFATGVVLYCDMARLVNVMIRPDVLGTDDNEPIEIKVIRLVDAVGSLLFRGIGALGSSYQLSPQTMMCIKVGEFTLKVTAGGVARVSEWNDEREGPLPNLRILERVFSYACRCLLTASEAMVYGQEHLLEQYSNGTTARWVNGGGDDDIAIEVPIDPKTCRTIIASIKNDELTYAIACLLTHEEIVSTAASKVSSLYQNMLVWLGFTIAPTESSNASPTRPPSNHQCRAITFTAFKEIPPPLAQDCIFSRYRCGISGAPIRDPVATPGSPTLYERATILHRLQTLPRSPSTGNPLLPHQLISKSVIKRLINNRLIFHQRHFWQYIETSTALQVHLSAPPNPVLQRAADQEYT